MRVIRTIILRFLVDTDQPQSLRGILQVVGDNEQHSFTDGQSLLELLQSTNQAGAHADSESDHEGNSMLVDFHS